MGFLDRSKPLQDLPRFGDLSEDEMRRVVEAGREVRVPEGWSLIGESTPADQAYLVIDGELEVRRHGKKIATLGRGDIVGEMGARIHKLRSATVTAASSLKLLHLTRSAFDELYDGVPAFKNAVDETVAQRQAENAETD